MLRFRRRNDAAQDTDTDDGSAEASRDAGEGAPVEATTPDPPSAAGDRAPVDVADEEPPAAPGEQAGLEVDGAEETRPTLRGRLGRSAAAPFRVLRRRQRIDEELLVELEEALLVADVGLPTTTRLLEGLREAARTREASDPVATVRALAVSFFDGDDLSLASGDAPSVWLFVGVNGVGKTTTIGKLARREALAGRSVVAAAGDTFRAAATEQLEIRAGRAGVEIVVGAEGADPASVVYDAIQHAAARGADLVLADTAGRLHTKQNLMAELEKVRRVADRPPGKVREVLLVIDATTGQNGLAQARQFAETAGVTGIVLTKLDGSAKGGVVLAIRSELGLPIKLVGLGEGPEDLVPFDPEEFVAALLDE